MRINKLLSLVFAGTLLLNVACTEDYDEPQPLVKGAYESGIIIANEGNFGKANAEVSFIGEGLKESTNGIFGKANAGAPLGDVLNSVAFNQNNAYLVLNNSNKITIVDRYSFQKKSEVTAGLVQPRHMVFSGDKYYVSNNDFYSTRKVNIYSVADNALLKSIPFDRYAEKLAEAAGYIYVQTDGVTYDSSYNELPTGHTISRINSATGSVDKPIVLEDPGIIRDMAAANGVVYVISSDKSNSYLYKINGADGTAAKIVFNGIASAQNIAADGSQLYIATSGNKVYTMSATATTAPTKSFDISAKYLYGFNVIDGMLYTADSNFTENSTVRVYNSTGVLQKTFTAGMGANGFYKN